MASDVLWIVSFKCVVKGYQECRFEFTYRGTTRGTREFNQLSFLPQEQCFVIGRFHTRGRANRLDWQIVSDEQIVWCENGTNKFFGEQIVSYLTVWKHDFSQTICPSRRTSRRQYNTNSHQTDKCQTICSSSKVNTAILKQNTLLKAQGKVLTLTKQTYQSQSNAIYLSEFGNRTHSNKIE